MDATALATFYAFVALVIFLAVIFYLKVPAKLTAGLDARAQKISDELAEAARLRSEANALLEDYKRRAGEAEREAQAIVAEARAEAERLTVETTKSLEEMIARRTRAAEVKIAQAETQALAEVRARAADVAIAAAEKVLAAKVKGQVADDMIRDSIGQIGAKLQ